jgi:nicotinamidase-related amidase
MTLEDLQLARSRTAVLVMDLQAGIVSRYTKDDTQSFLARVDRVLQWARANRLLLVFVRVGFRPGLPEVSASNQIFGAVKRSTQHQQLFEGQLGEIHPAIAPQQGEILVVKHRVSAFCGTDLDMIFRANGIDTLIVLGISTSGVVLSTVLEAADADYRLVVVADCCADLEPELHNVLIDKLFPRRAAVTASHELVEATWTTD